LFFKKPSSSITLVYSIISEHCLWQGALRQGLNRVARKVGVAGPARRGGDFRSHRKPAGAAPSNGGLPVKARLPPTT